MSKSFTLIEILVVIVVIGVLSAFILIGMNSITSSASAAKGQAFVNSMRNSLLMNLVSEWKFDGSGVSDGGTVTTAYTQDSWASNTGAVNGTPKVYSGSNCLKGSCILLNGSTDFISHAAIYFPDLSPQTFSVWVKWGTTVPTDYVIPFGFGAQTTANVYFTDGVHKWFLYRGSGQSSTQITGSDTLPIFNGKWHNVTWTVDSSRIAKFYIDGVQSGNTTTITGSTYIAYRYIGYGYDSNTYMWNGYIDELRVFNNVMPASQIQEKYYADLNTLIANNSILLNEFKERIVELKTNLANNE